LAYRPREVLPMDPGAVPADAVLLLDTTVYIDGMKRAGLPSGITALLANHVVRHSPICLGELAFRVGCLDPEHPRTQDNRSGIGRVLDRLSADTFVDLSPAGWTRAGTLAGSLARMQGLAQDRRRALFLDAALFMTAQEAGLMLVSASLSDMDLLLQVGGEAKVLLYEV
jgi:hypothetical protein